MKEIRSTENRRIKVARRISERKIEGYWLLEGKKLVSEALESGVKLREIFTTREAFERERAVFIKAEKQDVPVWLLPLSLMKKISRVESAPGIVAIAHRPARQQWMIPQTFAVLLLSIRDPGNFGAILRVAEAAGCEFLAYSSDCVDPFLPKVVRASAGSILRIPLEEIRDVGRFLQEQADQNLSIYTLDAHSGKNLFQEKPRVPALIVIGSESHGLPEDLPLNGRVRIPMEGKVESLNAAVAAGICFYWIAARRNKHD